MTIGIKPVLISILLLQVNSCGDQSPFTEEEKSEELEIESTSTTQFTSGQTYNSISEVPSCTAALEGVLIYVKDPGTFYHCKGTQLTQLGATKGDTGASGAIGAPGAGYSNKDLTQFNATQIFTSSSNNTGTNQFASGTGAVAPVNVTNITDSADALLTDATATTTYSQGTLGLATGFGCYTFDLSPILGTASLGRGFIYAKIGALVSTGSGTIAARWETSATGAASSFVLGASESIAATTTERVFYTGTQFFGRYVSYCLQGNASRNHIVRIYQIYVTM